ncbi:hypothetical protein Hanom_Chr12g01150341 [Helianthus anomalus]
MTDIRKTKYRRYIGKYHRYYSHRYYYRYFKPICQPRSDNRYISEISPRLTAYIIED